MPTKLEKYFNAATQCFPDLSGRTEALSVGAHGLVVDHGDETLTKIYFKPDNEAAIKRTNREFLNEVNVLRHFICHPLEGVETPVILEEPRFVENTDFIGAFKMTKISGICGKQYPMAQNENVAKCLMAANTGALIAHFHEQVAAMPITAGGHSSLRTESITAVSYWPDDMNEALQRADEYLKANSRAGNGHFDLHSGNIMFNSDRKATGLIDFSLMGGTANLDSDFITFYNSRLGRVIDGYNEVAAEKADKFQVMASNIAWWSCVASRSEPESMVAEEARDSVRQDLYEMREITGFRPA